MKKRLCYESGYVVMKKKECLKNTISKHKYSNRFSIDLFLV